MAPGVARTLAKSSRTRELALRLVRARARLGRGDPPRVFVTSVPKAGTHLATAILDELPRMRYSGWHVTPHDFRAADGRGTTVDWDRVERMLAGQPQGTFVRAHFPWAPRLAELLDRHGYRTIFVYRDPRDIAVSHAFYVTRLARHVVHARYAALETDSQRILASIVGSAADSQGPEVPPLARALEEFLPWRTAPGALSCRFEDLVGERGGGSAERQREVITEIARHVDRPLGPEQAQAVVDRAWSPTSITFRRGMIGDWMNHFDDSHREAFRGRPARSVIAYGYEDDDSWIDRPSALAGERAARGA